MQNELDRLYANSQKGRNFTDLMKLITTEENIMLAYRNIKNNNGSTTQGTDKLDITYYSAMEQQHFVKYIQSKLNNYSPKSVRRVEIPKPNGKTRPLGIPCMEDRIIQQCIKQILEPICEAKFHPHSYGFRPNRSVEHAKARFMRLVNQSNLHYIVDIDIEGFFDNVDHSKLIKQLWTLGVQDKNLIAVISKILKSEIHGVGIPNKGTPQGGIISPLLSNVVLNELDWWLSNQWETFETNYKYSFTNRCRAMKTTKLKEFYLVRYADDFKILCRDYETASKIFIATKQWLKERLGLNISPTKSKITNIRKNYTEFLGFKLKVSPKRNRYICKSRIANKAMENTINKLKEQIKVIQKKPVPKEVSKFNSMILGMHNYYKIATLANIDFSKIHFLVMKSFDARLKSKISKIPHKSKTYIRLYGGYNGRVRTIAHTTIFPIFGCKYKTTYSFQQEMSNYTDKGRALIHKKLGNCNILIENILKNTNGNDSTELSDNKISLIAGQQGKCYVTKKPLQIGDMQCHHKIPRSQGGTDEYNNLVWLSEKVHTLVHSTHRVTIEEILNTLKLDSKGITKVNSLRKLVGNLAI